MIGRVLLAGLLLFVVSPTSAAAQLMTMRPTPPPLVTAEGELWFQRGEPITHEGDVYLPAGPKVFFDGAVMVRTGSFRGIPLYVDRTRGPLSAVFVPLSGQLMQPYVRRPIPELDQPIDGRLYTFDIAGAAETEAVLVPAPAREVLLAAPEPAERRAELLEPPGRVDTLQEPAGLQAIFIEWSGARWRGTGPATRFDPARFVRIGEHAGFAVYAERGDNSGRRIFLPMREGYVTRFERMENPYRKATPEGR